MNTTKKLNVGDLVEKPVVRGYTTGEETHTLTYRVTGYVTVGKLKKVWAVGVVVASTDPRETHLGEEFWVGLAEGD